MTAEPSEQFGVRAAEQAFLTLLRGITTLPSAEARCRRASAVREAATGIANAAMDVRNDAARTLLTGVDPMTPSEVAGLMGVSPAMVGKLMGQWGVELAGRPSLRGTILALLGDGQDWTFAGLRDGVAAAGLRHADKSVRNTIQRLVEDGLVVWRGRGVYRQNRNG